MRIAAMMVSLVALGTLAGEITLGCAGGDKKCAIQKAREHPARKLAHWKDNLTRPIEERLGQGNAELVEYITLDNIGNGYPQRPRPAKADPEFLADLRAAVAELPPVVKRLLQSKLVGVLLVEDFGGTGFTDEIVDESGKAVAGFVVLDPSVLRDHTANSWITWRENTPFKPSNTHRLVARIAPTDKDNRRRAIQYILLHELAHVLSIGERIHPSWTKAPAEVGSTDQYTFFNLSWRIDGERYVPLKELEFPLRKDVVYYFGPRLESAQMQAAYDALGRTNFATLYSATHYGDDFAEAFANYVHVVMMKRPFSIEIRRDGRLVKTYRPCWGEPRCAAKRRMLEKLLKPSPRPSP